MSRCPACCGKSFSSFSSLLFCFILSNAAEDLLILVCIFSHCATFLTCVAFTLSAAGTAMALRRKQQRSRLVVATPHPTRVAAKRTSAVPVSACDLDSAEECASAGKPHEAANSSASTSRTVSVTASSRQLRSASTRRRGTEPKEPILSNTAKRKRNAGKSKSEPLEPLSKRKRPLSDKAKKSSGYAGELASAGFRYPQLATDQPAATVHSNRPGGEFHPSVARRKPLTLEEARMLTKDDPPVRVYADGVFDLFHLGHARVLMQAKQTFANVCLVSGIPCDEVVNEMKGQTVLTAKERLAMMQHNRYVDEVIEDAPFTPTIEFLDRHKIDFVVHDAKPLGIPGKEDIYAEVKEANRFIGTQRTEGISTSDLIARIVRNYDTYVLRNLSRGYSREGMGLNYMKEQGVKARGRMGEMMRTWKGSRHALIGDFLKMFGPVTGPIASLFTTMAGASETASSGSSRSKSRSSRSQGRFGDVFDDDEDDEQDEDAATPWFKETTEFLLSESDRDSGEDHSPVHQAD